MSSIRKSTRTRTLTVKAKTNTNTAVTKQQVPETHVQDHDQHINKKRKITRETEAQEEQSDKIDPVEKLLSLTSTNNDFLSDLESSSEEEEEEEEYIREIASVNFTKILQDNIRNYYSRKLRMNQYDDTFALLNKNTQQSETSQLNSTSEPSSPKPSTRDEVPFFKNVNFGKSREYTIDDFFAYNDEEEEQEPKSPTEEISSPTTSSPTLYIPKINQRFNYRQNHLNLASDYQANSPNNHSQMATGMSPSSSQDIFKILNKRCILTGRASEMVSTGNFLINDFFL
ncbi:uncharacterized protein J8A68_003925 [[Candida] subhashii]|uniref:Uncharacterized protein n=1 Tax=[Candida] subhashii TaxID=561895 RepID=A0A8J5UL44_9ASCO|nr:uncharacterized protein J8A68_003925 [[Candida] subhashii]KAG7662551.1 hypothetical protein J8A68_003925 [[Candida] subhashii]